MKYFEVDRPYYALVKASTPSEAISLYVRDISDADDDEGMRHLELFLFRFHNFFLSFDTPKRQLWPFSSLARFSWNSFLMASSFSGSSMSCAPVRARIFAP